MVNFVCNWRQSVPVENLWKTIDSCGKLFLCSYTSIKSYESYGSYVILCVYYGSYVLKIHQIHQILM